MKILVTGGHTKANISKSIDLLNYKPEVDFEKGIKLTLESYNG